MVFVLVMACHGTASPPVTVHVTCSADRQRVIAVDRDVRLDASLCGDAWDSLGIAHGGRTELIHARAGREVWLVRRAGHAAVEVRTPGTATATFDGVTELDAYPPPPPPPSLAITVAGSPRQLPLDELRRLAPAGQRDIPLCALADAYAPHAERVVVEGEAPQPVVVPRAECASRGLVLRIGGKGDVRLRGADGAHVLQRVRAISL